MEELLAALRARGIAAPRALGVTHARPDRSPDAERTALGAFLTA